MLGVASGIAIFEGCFHLCLSKKENPVSSATRSAGSVNPSAPTGSSPASQLNKFSQGVHYRKNPNVGALTNFEVLEFLKARGASKDTSRVIAPIAPSVYKVFDYLMETPACRQTKEQINEFLEKSKTYNLAKAEILNIINLAPHELVELDPIIENSDMRFGDRLEELKDLVCLVFPPPQGEPAAEAGNEDNGESEVADG